MCIIDSIETFCGHEKVSDEELINRIYIIQLAID